MAGLSLGPAAPAAPVAPAVPAEERYTREALLGAGGMGRVYLAHDRRLGRLVALKEAREGAAAAAAIAHEVAVAGRLEHPGIITLHDQGVGPDGRPWYTMQLIRGRTLGARVAEAPDLAARLLLLTHFRDACQAVAYAHSQGIIHRDLKPDNVLLGAFGETQVVDWGLAASADLPATAAVAGSPAWMAPEQAQGGPVDARADVWGLGAVLYFLLSGQALRAGLDGSAALRAAREEPPPPLGQAISGVPPELAAIVGRALAWSPQERYPDALALAQDVERYLTGERVRAHQYSPIELLGRALRVWRAPLLVAAVAALLLLGLAGLSARRLADERDTAVQARVAAERALQASLVAQARQLSEAQRAGSAGILGAAALGLGEDPEARGAALAALASWPVRRVSATAVQDCPSPLLAGDGWLCRSSAAIWATDASGVRRWTAALSAVSVTVAGAVLAAQQTHDVSLLALATGRVLETHPRIWPLPLIGTHDGRFASRRWEGQSWSGGLSQAEQRQYAGCAPHGLPRESVLHPTQALHASWCADGHVAFTDEAGAVAVWDTGISVAEHGDASVLAWSSDGQHLALGWYSGRVGWLDRQTGAIQTATRPDRSAVVALVPSPDGALLATRWDDGTVLLWGTATLTLVAELPGQDAVDMRWEDSDHLRVLGTTDALWRVERRPVPPVLRLGAGVAELLLSPSGDTLISTHGDGRVVSTPLQPGAPSWQRLAGRGAIVAADLTPTGEALFLAAGEEQHIQHWHPDGSVLPARFPVPEGARSLLARSPEEVWIVGFGGAIFRRRGDAFVPEPSCEGTRWRALLASPAREALVLGIDGTLVPLDSSGCGEPLAVPAARWAALGPSAGWLILLSAEGLSRIHTDGPAVWSISLDVRNVQDLVLSPDGRWVAVGGRDHAVRLLDARDGTLRALFRGHSARAAALAFTPDSRVLFSGDWEGDVRLWPLEALEDPPAQLQARLEARGWPTASELLAATAQDPG